MSKTALVIEIGSRLKWGRSFLLGDRALGIYSYVAGPKVGPIANGDSPTRETSQGRSAATL